MSSKKWVKIWLFSFFIITLLINIFTYIVDPYDIYNHNLVSKMKIQQSDKIRLIKVLKIKQVKPESICLGTSRAEFGYNPDHKYFSKPSYNAAISGGTMYETKLNLRWAIEQGNLKQVLLVLDYRMLDRNRQKYIADFESYYDLTTQLKALFFNFTILRDSFITLINNKHNNSDEFYHSNGQRDPIGREFELTKNGGHLHLMKKKEKNYFSTSTASYVYQDTRLNSFNDFKEFVEICYQNNIELDIIFGPSHIRLWESFNYFLGFDKFLRWKKDVIVAVNEIAKKYDQKVFRIMDFAVYHPLTAEKVPVEKSSRMKYHWETSHYKSELGEIVLDRLINESKYKDFGIELTIDNIDEHLIKQTFNRKKYIDTDLYQSKVFGNK